MILDRRGVPVAGGFEWKKEPKGDWQRQLADLAPETQSLSWLKIVWVPGTPQDPVQRWVLFQMTPRAKVPELVVDLLDGPPPHPIHNPVDLLREQWDLWRQHHCWAQPFWIIQGAHGGHKRHFNRIEQLTCKLMGAPIHPPVAGALPYAPFDQRVLDKLVPLDRVRFWQKAAEYEERSPEQMDQEEKDAVRVLKGQLWDWLSTQVDRSVDDVLTLQNRGAVLDEVTSRDGVYLDADQAKQDILTRSE